MNAESRRSVGLLEAQSRLSELIAVVEAGETIELVRGGVTVALISPATSPARRIDRAWLQRVTDSMPMGHAAEGELEAVDLRRRSDASRY